MCARSTFRKNCLVPLTAPIKKYRFVGFDVETVNDVFYSGGLWWIDEQGVEQWFYTTNKEELIKKVLSRYFTDYKIVATNLSYDFNSLFFNTPYWNQFNSVIMRGSRIMFADWRPFNSRKVYNNKRSAKHGRVTFYDTLNYALMSVEQLGKILGLYKIKQPEFLGKRAPLPLRVDYRDVVYGDNSEFVYKQTIHLEQPKFYYEAQYLQEYNKRDCMISCLFAYFYQDGLNELGGKLQMTAASSSLDLYRRRYMKDMIIKEGYILRDDSVKDFIFEGYYGGRTEVFSRGKFEGVNYYDVNSLYPSVMRESMPLPQSVKRIKDCSADIISKYMGVTRAEVYVPDMKYPPLPVRKTKLLFPTGRFVGVWNNNELSYAMSLGVKILSIKEQIIYQESHKPFVEFVEDLYSKRLEYKKAGNRFEVIVKLMLNSLYGKFAQKTLGDYRVFEFNDKMPEEFAKETFKKKSKYDISVEGSKIIFRRDKVSNGVFSFPIYSSYITSYARIHMHKLILEHNALYTDTDSIITYDKIDSSALLGGLKEEGSNEDCVIVKPKFYYFGSDVKIKGLTKTVNDEGNIVKTTKKDFDTILRGEKVFKKRFSGLKESVRRGILPNTSIIVPKTMGLEDDKRVWEGKFSVDGNEESIPLKLGIYDGLNLTTEEFNRMYDSLERKELLRAVKDYNKTATVYINNNTWLRAHFRGRVRELRSVFVDCLSKGVCLDVIDWGSFGNDVSVWESYENMRVEGVH